MTTQNRRDFATRARPAPGPVDFTVMYAAHDAFDRDLTRLTEAVRSGRTADPAVRAGWATFKNQLHLHHTAEDVALWPALRRQVTDPAQIAVLDAMEAEHARIDPLLAQVDAALAAGHGAGGQGRPRNASAAELADVLTGHMAHEEDEALPLVAAHLGAAGWAAFGRRAGRGTRACGARPSSSPGCSTGRPPTRTRRLLGPAAATGPPAVPGRVAPGLRPSAALGQRDGLTRTRTPDPGQNREGRAMNITVFGATGGTGACLLRQALAAGHRVTAVVRDPARLASWPAAAEPRPEPSDRQPSSGRTATAAPPRLEVITADVMDPAAIGPAVAGADAVLSAIGPHGSGPTTVSQDSAAAIIAAMHAGRRAPAHHRQRLGRHRRRR